LFWPAADRPASKYAGTREQGFDTPGCDMNKAAAFQFLQQHAGLLSPGITQRYLRSATWALGL